MTRERRLSEFNYIVERPDCVLGYNIRTGSFLLLNTSSVRALRGECPLSDLAEGTLAALQENGFVVTEDERESLSRKLHSALLDRETHIVIVPTLACNFRCDYCFQNEMRSANVMDAETASRIVQFVEARLRHGRAPTKITWFGGEPLLAIDFIEGMSKKLKDVYSSASATLPQVDIVTNGTLLSAAYCDRLRAAGITKVQVSFDSLHFEKAHFRGVLNPDGTPSIIAANALEALKAGIETVVRVNVDTRNFDHVDAIKGALGSIGLGHRTYFARVEDDHHDLYSPPSPHRLPVLGEPRLSSCSLGREQFAKKERQLIFERQKFGELLRKLAPRTHFCGATDGSMLVISPDGGVSRCWNSAGRKKEEICNIRDANFEEGMAHSATSQAWDHYSPFDYETCAQCRVLPICMGGCSHPRTMAGRTSPPCTPVKYYIDELVEYVGQHLNVEAFKC